MIECPKCKAPEIDLDYDINYDQGVFEWSCWECGHEWTIPYTPALREELQI